MDVMVSHKATLNGSDIPYLISFNENKVFGGIFGFGLSYKPVKLYTFVCRRDL
jgi:hypothetical protein